MEVERLLVKAEQADSQGEMEPATLPQEIAKPQALKTFKPDRLPGQCRLVVGVSGFEERPSVAANLFPLHLGVFA